MNSKLQEKSVSKVSSDYYVACHYFPGWNVYDNGYSPFSDILDYPDRTPLLGYYDESRPDVFDWQAKWALEHGIRCFIYCWYRKFGNVGNIVTESGLSLCHAITAQKQSSLGRMIDYAIMWECDNAGGISDVRDLTEHLLPFWVKEYFSDPNYLKIGNRPVLFYYDPKGKLGSREKRKEAFDALKEKIRDYGYDGIVILSEYRGLDKQRMDMQKQLGFSGQFSYCIPIPGVDVPQDEIVAKQQDAMQTLFDYDPYFSVLTCSVGWNPEPWQLKHKDRFSQNPNRWFLTPENFKRVLYYAKSLADQAPKDSLMSKIMIMDNWNEWCEGHYLMPHEAGGFEYLKAIREVFTKCDNVPDCRLPNDREKETFAGSIDFDAECVWYSF